MEILAVAFIFTVQAQYEARLELDHTLSPQLHLCIC